MRGPKTCWGIWGPRVRSPGPTAPAAGGSGSPAHKRSRRSPRPGGDRRPGPAAPGAWPALLWWRSRVRRGSSPPGSARCRRSRTSAGTTPGPPAPAPGTRLGGEDAYLAVLCPPGGAGVLPLHPGRGGALLHKARVVDDQHTAWSPSLSATYACMSSRRSSGSHRARLSRCCSPSGLASPVCSAIV
jgi:hypothetical protein